MTELKVKKKKKSVKLTQSEMKGRNLVLKKLQESGDFDRSVRARTVMNYVCVVFGIVVGGFQFPHCSFDVVQAARSVSLACF